MSFIRYPGGKAKLRDRITQRLLSQAGGKTEYREPFFGGGSIGLELLSVGAGLGSYWLNDRDVGIACMWTAVIHHPGAFKDRVQGCVPSVPLFHELRAELLGIAAMPADPADVVDIGYKKLAIHQMSYSGLGTKSGGPLGGSSQKSTYPIDCRWSPGYICKQVDKLHDLFRGVEARCTNLDFAATVEDDSRPALVYLDPPYYVKGNDLYQHGFSESDHRRLMESLKRTRHAWLLSYDDSQEIRDMYDWATVEVVNKVNYTITATKDRETGKRSSRNKTELLIHTQGTVGDSQD